MLVGNPPWPRPEIAYTTLAPPAGSIKTEANRRYALREEYKWLDEVHAKLTFHKPERQPQRGWRPATSDGAADYRMDQGHLTSPSPRNHAWSSATPYQEQPQRAAPQQAGQSGASSSWAGSSWEQNSISEKWQPRSDDSTMGAASPWQANSGWETSHSGHAAHNRTGGHRWAPGVTGSLPKRHRDSQSDQPWDSDSGRQEPGKRTRPGSSSASSRTAPDHWEEANHRPPAHPRRR